MSLAKAEGRPLPVVIEINGRDAEAEKKIKQIILDMTQYDPKRRPAMDVVELQLTDLMGK